MRWVKIVEVVVAVALAAVAVVGRAGWAAPLLPALEASVCAQAVGTRSRTWRDSRAIRRNAPSAARRWSARRKKEADMPGMKDGCVKPARGPLIPESRAAAQAVEGTAPQEVKKMLAHVGREAPDFEASAFVEGVGFKPVKLSGYRGKWIVLCFYPGDFTFV